LLDRSARGRIKITARGIEALKKNPPRIDNAFLKQFEEYKAFTTKRIKAADDAGSGDVSEVRHLSLEITPDEQLDAAYKELRDALADELLARVRSVKPKRFERLVVDVLVAMGYGGTGGRQERRRGHRRGHQGRSTRA
jgi:restriction system protein